jgi:hypothetical protein
LHGRNQLNRSRVLRRLVQKGRSLLTSSNLTHSRHR